MLSHVQLRDFKPDVVICPRCTQHLMGVKDVQWASDCVSFTYGCAGCGHEIDRPVGEDAFPAAALSGTKLSQAITPQAKASQVKTHQVKALQTKTPHAKAQPIKASQAKAPEPAPEPTGDITSMDDLGPFPFREPSEPSHPLAFEAADTGAADSGPVADDPDETGGNLPDQRDERAPFGSRLLLPPRPWLDIRLDTPVFPRRTSPEPALTPKQVFDVERRDSERRDDPLPEAEVTTRASVLLRDVSIF